MTPKEKAKELVDKFYKSQVEVLAKDGTAPIDLIEHEISKKCALIAVDEILDLDSGDAVNKDYWDEVKKEIELL